MIILLNILLILLGSIVLQHYIAARVPVLGKFIAAISGGRTWIGFFMCSIAVIMVIPTTLAILFFSTFSFRSILTIASVLVALFLGLIEGMPLLEAHIKPYLKDYWIKVEKFYAHTLPYHMQLGKSAFGIGLVSLLLLL